MNSIALFTVGLLFFFGGVALLKEPVSEKPWQPAFMMLGRTVMFLVVLAVCLVGFFLTLYVILGHLRFVL